MIRLTKKQKLDAYMYALSCCYAYGRSIFVCINLARWLEHSRIPPFDIYELKGIFPEFFVSKPIDLVADARWWPLKDRHSRIKALTNAIKLL